MLAVALVADVDPTRQRQETDLVAAPQRVVSPVDVAERGRDVVGSLDPAPESASWCSPCRRASAFWRALVHSP